MANATARTRPSGLSRGAGRGAQFCRPLDPTMNLYSFGSTRKFSSTYQTPTRILGVELKKIIVNNNKRGTFSEKYFRE